MRTQVDSEGVGPSNTNIWYHPRGQVCTFGGDVTVQVLPPQETAGKSVRCPMLLPCVLTVAPMSETLMFAVEPDVTVKGTEAP